MKLSRFRVEGDPVGYQRMTRGPHGVRHNKDTKRYHVYCETVRESAAFVGKLQVPLRASEDKPVFVATRCHFRRRMLPGLGLVIPDCGNVQKGIEDALCYKAKGGDRFVAGFYFMPELIPEEGKAWVDVVVGPYDQDMEDLARRFFKEEVG